MYTREVQGYKWANINGANAANASVKTAMGIPVSPEATTQEAIEPKISLKLDGSIDFYFYEGYLSPLGNMTIFTVREIDGI